jgi:hypothetical protein
MTTSERQSNVLLKILERYSLDESSSSSQNSKEHDKFWCDLFFEECIDKSSQIHMDVVHQDDLLYFVKRRQGDNNANNKKKNVDDDKEKFFVRRKDNLASLPSKYDTDINWEETFFLNVILHHFEYTMRVTVRIRNNTEKETSPRSSRNLNMKTEVRKTVTMKNYI